MRDDSIIDDIIRALVDDPKFQFKQAGNMLVEGLCPNCGERECFVSLEKPFKVMCNRRNNCGYSESTRKIYAHFFGNISERYHPSEADPFAPATAYLIYNRGFSPETIKGLYRYGHQRAYDDKKKQSWKDCPAVVFDLDNGSYQARFIDDSDEKRFKKTRTVGPYKDSGWVPPKMQVKKDDTIFITEAIFKSIAFLEIGKKSITGLSCSNLPLEFIKKHADKKINWVIAFDNDTAGIDGTRRARKMLKDLKQTCFCIIPKSGEDWDDVFRAGKLEDSYIIESGLRWAEMAANTNKEKAFYHYLQTKKSSDIIFHGHQIYKYSYKVEDSEDVAIMRNADIFDPITIHPAFDNFTNQCEIELLCEGYIDLVYTITELSPKPDEYPINYYNVSYRKGAAVHSKLISGDGSVYLSTKKFNETLTQQTGGNLMFFGKNEDLLALRSLWRKKDVPIVTKVRFFGYVEKFDTYIYSKFIYHKGIKTMMNENDYATVGEHAVSCDLADKFMNIEPNPEPFNPEWITPYKKYFGHNGMVILSWWIGTLFAEQVRGHSEHWPFLECIGAPGTGKSTAIKFLWKTLGAIDAPQGFDPNRTSMAGLARQIAQFSNLPIVLMESDRASKDNGKQKGFDFTDFKPCFEKNAILRAVGVAGGKNDTEILYFKGGLLIMQNADIISDKAGYERLVQCKYEDTIFSREAIRAVDDMNARTGKELGGFLHHIMKNGDAIIDGYKREYERVYNMYTELEETEKACSSLRIRRTHAQIAAFARLLPYVFDNQVSIEEAEAIVKELWERAKKQYARCQGDTPTLERFWDSFDYLCGLSTLVGTTYVPIQLNHANKSNEIAISLPEVQKIAFEMKVNLPSSDVLINEFKNSIERKCLGQKTVRSALTNKSLKCWVFQLKEG